MYFHIFIPKKPDTMKSRMLLLLLAICHINLFAQIGNTEIPFTWQYPDHCRKTITALTLPPIDTDLLRQQDAEQNSSRKKLRFGVLLPVDASPENSGTWETTGTGGSLWRLMLVSEGAKALNLYFDDFYLPAGSSLHVYSADKEELIGGFDSKNNTENRKFAIAPLNSDSIVVEYYQPPDCKGKPALHIMKAGHSYINPGLESSKRDFGDSDFCQINVNCAEGNNWQEQKRAVVRCISTDGEYEYWCSGALINNTALDFKPYILTAEHNICSEFGTIYNEYLFSYFIFCFKYEAPECQSPEEEGYLGRYTMTGCTYRASSHDEGGETGSDFALLELLDEVPAAYDPYYAGWDRRNSSIETGVAIHHPFGDLKKISTTGQVRSSSFTGTTKGTHWKTVWIETENGRGVTEGGSSGSPLFNSAGNIVGTLTGGSSTCNNYFDDDYFGKMSYHWTSNGTSKTSQLRPWLDPENSEVETLAGIDHTYNLLQNVENKPNIQLFPIPVRDKLYLNISEMEKHKVLYISIFNTAGVKVHYSEIYKTQNCLNEINLVVLPSGIYIVRIELPDKQVIVNEKIAKINQP